MRKITLLIIVLLSALFMSGQDYSIKPIWVKSVNAGNNPTWNAGSNVRDMDYYNGKLYLNDKNLKALHVVNAATGAEEADIPNDLFTGYSVCFDAAGTAVITQGAWGMTKCIKVSAMLKDGSVIDLGTTNCETGGRIDYLEAIGDLTSSSGGFIVGATTTASSDNICVWPVFSGKPYNPTTPLVFPNLRNLKGDPTYADISAAGSTSAWATGLNMIPVKINVDMTTMKPSTEILAIDAPGASGIAEFKLNDHSFVAVPVGNTGAIVIYDITEGCDKPEKVAETTEALGEKGMHTPIEAVVSGDKALIYVFSLDSGLGAYEFGVKEEATAISLPYKNDFSLIDTLGASLKRDGYMPPIVLEETRSKLEGIADVVNVYAAGGKLKFSTSESAGHLTTLPITINAETQIQICFDATAWAQTKTAKNANLKITYGDQTKEIEIKHKDQIGWPVNQSDLTGYNVMFKAIKTPTAITIEAIKGGDLRAFIDNLTITDASELLIEPTITPASGIYFEEQTVTITANEGTTIRYTTDGTDPTATTGTVYTAPFKVSTNTTVKAIAVKDNISEISEANYQFPTVVTSIADIRKGKQGDLFYLTSEATITFLHTSRNLKYIQDATGAILIDDATGLLNKDYAMYDNIKNICGTLGDFNGMSQLVIKIDGKDEKVSSGNEITPKVVALADLANYPAQLVKVENVEFEDATGKFASGKSYALKNSSVVLITKYNNLDYLEQDIPTEPYDITGVVLMYNKTAQLVPRQLSDFKLSTSSRMQQEATTNVYSINGDLVVNAEAGKMIEVYNINGQLVITQLATGTHTVISGMPANQMLFVKIDGKMFKTIIR